MSLDLRDYKTETDDAIYVNAFIMLRTTIPSATTLTQANKSNELAGAGYRVRAIQITLPAGLQITSAGGASVIISDGAPTIASFIISTVPIAAITLPIIYDYPMPNDGFLPINNGLIATLVGNISATSNIIILVTLQTPD